MSNRLGKKFHKTSGGGGFFDSHQFKHARLVINLTLCTVGASWRMTMKELTNMTAAIQQCMGGEKTSLMFYS